MSAIPYRFVTAALVACSQGTPQPASTAADEDAIRSATSAITAAMAAGEFDRFLAFFPNDIVMMPPDQPIVRGKEAFNAFARPFVDRFSMQETISYTDIRVAGDWAVGTYTYVFAVTPKNGGATSREEGKGVILVTRSADGSWQWTQSVCNRDQVPSPHPTTR